MITAVCIAGIRNLPGGRQRKCYAYGIKIPNTRTALFYEQSKEICCNITTHVATHHACWLTQQLAHRKCVIVVVVETNRRAKGNLPFSLIIHDAFVCCHVARVCGVSRCAVFNKTIERNVGRRRFKQKRS